MRANMTMDYVTGLYIQWFGEWEKAVCRECAGYSTGSLNQSELM